ncbi:protein fuzzy homolog [Lates japonicus]|uniref:Protein fuzzy homolog n=1 Tax=Lates japonicus TaxID=270547 RepID=A0AAD3MB77_LATJO|nr:protein fuzzy homolog [Lates japonicus]
MGQQLLCLTASSGVSSFLRSLKQLLLCHRLPERCAHVWRWSGAVLLSCYNRTEGGSKVVWRVFQDDVLCTPWWSRQGGGMSGNKDEEDALQRLLENVWNCMGAGVGAGRLANMGNSKGLKRLWSCFNLIDQLMEDRQEEHPGVAGTLTLIHNTQILFFRGCG